MVIINRGAEKVKRFTFFYRILTKNFKLPVFSFRKVKKGFFVFVLCCLGRYFPLQKGKISAILKENNSYLTVMKGNRHV